MRKTLRPYQQEGLEKFKDEDSMFLAMEMRLGKSLVTLRWLKLKGASRTMIIAPKTVLIGWQEELADEGIRAYDLTSWSLQDREILIRSTKHLKNIAYLMNYESIDRLSSVIGAAELDCIVCDESTALKNHRAGVTKALMRICETVPLKVCLSGLPVPQSYFDLFTQLQFLGDGFCMGLSNFYKWQRRVSNKYGYDFVFKPKELAKFKREFHRLAYVLTRKQAGLGETKIYQKRSAPLNPREQRIYDKILKDWEIPGMKGDDGETKYAMVIASWLRRLCGGFLPEEEVESWKYKALVDIVCKDLPAEQIVVWFAFNSELTKAADILEKAGVKCDYMLGGTKQDKRRKIIKSFQAGKCRVVLIQQRLGRFGLRLSAADTAIYFSNSYSLEDRAQSEDRIVDVEKKNPLLYIDFVTEDTIEEDVVEALQDKSCDAKFLMARIHTLRSLAIS